MHLRAALILGIAAWIWGLLCPAAHGQLRGGTMHSVLTAPWQVDVAPFYLWLPATEGDVTILGRSLSIGTDIGETEATGALGSLLQLNMGATGRVEVRKGDLVSTFDLLYLNVGHQTDSPFGNLDFQFEVLNVEFGAGYRLFEWPLGAAGGTPTLAFEVLGGGRYVSLDTEADFDLTAGPITTQEELAADVDWLDPFVGGRVRLDLSRRLTFVVRGDAGGFGVGSDLTWTVQGGVLFHVTPLFSVGVGYRVMDIDYTQGSGLSRFAFDVLLHGPQVGMVFHF